MNCETQNKKPDVCEPLEKVGVKNLRTLVKVGSKDNIYKFVPRIEITVDLPAEKKGAHMSRLIESISEIAQQETFERHDTFEILERNILDQLEKRHPYTRGEINIDTELVVNKKTPVTKKPTHETHDIGVKLVKDHGKFRKTLKVKVLGNTVCPHAMQNTGKPHIQRAIAEIEIECDYNNKISLEQIINVAEKSFSSEVYTLLKTEDENSVVERMYANPRFVEDVTRAILKGCSRFKGCKIKARTTAQESIHRHDVIAEGFICT